MFDPMCSFFDATERSKNLSEDENTPQKVRYNMFLVNKKNDAHAPCFPHPACR
jgi:hypothetical protein